MPATLLKIIHEKRWWQGSIIPTSDLSEHIEDIEEQSDVDYWVIVSQACNIYNSCFEKVPVFELVAGRTIDKCDPQKVKGDNPRILHVQAESEDGDIMFLEIDIQRRLWLLRKLLAIIPKATFHVRDTKRDTGIDWSKNLWLDNIAGWLARSYTRIALPDAFNYALQVSRIEEILKKKLITHKDELYGIYLSVTADADQEWKGILGEMPPPYLLEIMLVTYEEVDPESIKGELLGFLFNQEIADPDQKTQKVTRTDLARRHGVRLVPSAVEARTIAGITLLELKSLIRYTFIDHLSDSSMAATN